MNTIFCECNANYNQVPNYIVFILENIGNVIRMKTDKILKWFFKPI